MPTEQSNARVRLVFADEGTFHAETILVPLERLDEYERLIDLLREDPSVTRHIHIDMKRLVSAYVVRDDQ
ncbi:MAG: hypothetical protein KY464_04170 [Gemmatimonadetes bacterium]|nr:hypothetical protein [Gemmatimonadota bacterium]